MILDLLAKHHLPKQTRNKQLSIFSRTEPFPLPFLFLFQSFFQSIPMKRPLNVILENTSKYFRLSDNFSQGHVIVAILITSDCIFELYRVLQRHRVPCGRMFLCLPCSPIVSLWQKYNFRSHFLSVPRLFKKKKKLKKQSYSIFSVFRMLFN